MKRMDRIAVKEIARRRNSKLVPTEQPGLSQETHPHSHSNKQVTYESVLGKILRHEGKGNQRCELTAEEKHAIVEHISEKEKISYNKSTLAELMTVWRCPGTTYVSNSEQKDKDKEKDKDKVKEVRQSECKSGGFGDRALNNFYLLTGAINVYEIEAEDEGCPPSDIDDRGETATFSTQSKQDSLKNMVEGQEPKKVLEENTCWGALFRKKEHEESARNSTIFKISNAVIVEVRPPELEGMLVNLGGMDQEKKIKIIESYSIFSAVTKKVLSILPYIQFKKYTKNQAIYRMKQQPNAMYLVLKGQIIFQVRLQIPYRKQRSQSLKNITNQIMLQTEAIGPGNYFGEEEIIFKDLRNVNTICNSAECDVLEIPLEKLERLFGCSDFYDGLKDSAMTKIAKRKEKISKALEIYLQFGKSPDKMPAEEPEPTMQTGHQRANSFSEVISFKSAKKRQKEPAKVMHGNIIRPMSRTPQTEPINFSMLKTNPDMYESTMKKFRKYSIKPLEKYKPEVNWNLKRVWKVLNLQSILREDGQVSSPEGRKFYESHRRLQNHVSQVKSLRPKTSSSTYRTKLQYIAYLQQFNN